MPIKDYSSITISKEYYEIVKEIAKSKDWSIAKLIEYLIKQYNNPEIRALIDAPKGSLARVEWSMWPGPYEKIVSDPDIKRYLSTAWIRSKEYPKNAGKPQWAIDTRVKEGPEFTVEKLFVVSRKAWDIKEVWDWIGDWLIYTFRVGGARFKVFVTKEDAARRAKIGEKYYDMGIYGDPPKLLGFLKLDESSETQSYTWVSPSDEKEKNEAFRSFEELKNCGKLVKTFEDLQELRRQDYD